MKKILKCPATRSGRPITFYISPEPDLVRIDKERGGGFIALGSMFAAPGFPSNLDDILFAGGAISQVITDSGDPINCTGPIVDSDSIPEGAEMRGLSIRIDKDHATQFFVYIKEEN